MVREELLREWQDVPSNFQEFVRQHKVAAKDIYPGIDRVLMSYQETAESDTKELAQDILMAVMGVIFDKLEARLSAKKQAPQSGMRQKTAA